MRYLHHTSTNDHVAKYPTQWKIYFDPVCSIIFALLILKSSLPLIRHCAAILMQSVPSSISFFDLKKKLLRRNLAATRTRRRRSATASKQLFGRLSGTTRRLFFGSTQLLCGAKHEQLACVGCPCAQRSFFPLNGPFRCARRWPCLVRRCLCVHSRSAVGVLDTSVVECNACAARRTARRRGPLTSFRRRQSTQKVLCLCGACSLSCLFGVAVL